MRTLTRTQKATVVVAAGALGVAGTGIAWAYYAGDTVATASGSASVVDSTVAPLTAAASTVAGLVPGTSQSVTVTLTNPNAFAVNHPGKTVSVASASGGSCTTDEALLSGSGSLSAGVVAAGGTTTVTFSVAMADSSTVNQTDCKGATLTVSYGIA